MFLALLASPLSSFAGELALDSTVLKVRNTSNNSDTFEVVLDKNVKNCFGNVIAFPSSAAPNKETHARAYASALTALTTGLKVRIYAYADADECKKASYIELTK